MREIAARVGVSVSSVSLWTRDIVLSVEQVSKLERGNHRFGAQNHGWVARAQSARAVRVAAQEHGRELARTGDPLHLAAHLVVHSTFIAQSIYGAIQEYVGIHRGEWIDCTPPSRDLAPSTPD